MNSVPAIGLLMVMLAVAVYVDVTRHRIPNKLTLVGLCVALVLQAVTGGVSGMTSGVLGAVAGFACFVPLYMLRGMGAGDVKLLAAVGAFLGPMGAAAAAVCSLLAGGLSALGYVCWRVLRACVTSWTREGSAAVGASAFVAARLARRDRLPFALPIAAGSLAAVVYSMHSTNVASWLRSAL